MFARVVSRNTTTDELLSEYEPTCSSLFAAPGGSMLAEGDYLVVPPSERGDELEDLPDRVEATLGRAEAAGHGARAVVGAVPFAPHEPARLVVPQRLRYAGRPRQPHQAQRRRSPQRCTAVPEPAAEHYVRAVRRAVEQMRAGEYSKVVLARSLRLTPDGALDIRALVRELAERDPSGYTYAMDLGAGRTLLGASPELLVSRSGARVVANPMAGSVPRSPDPDEDAARAASLLASAKDGHEHALVVDAVEQTLRPLCATLDVPGEPSVTSTATMWHLSTRITGELDDPSLSALALAARLHPTPAVCGTPTGTARRAIGELEPLERGFYAGMVGYNDADGDGQWVITIRCGVAEESSLRVYAGAGIVADSDPDAELAETTAKFRTLLDALGLSEDG